MKFSIKDLYGKLRENTDQKELRVWKFSRSDRKKEIGNFIIGN